MAVSCELRGVCGGEWVYDWSMTRLGVSPRLRPLALVAAVCVVASSCGADTPADGWADVSPIPPADDTASEAATGSQPDSRSRSRPATSSAPVATTSTVTTTPPPSPTDPATTAPITIASAAPPTTSAPTTTAPRSTRRNVLIIGDSSAASMRWSGGTDALRGAEFTLDAESCRRLVEPSCPGDGGKVPSTAIDALRIRAGGDHDTLVVATGYNDMDRDFDEAFDVVFAEARSQGLDTVVWLTYREDVGFQLPSGSAPAYAEMNESLRLRELSGEYPELRLLDWWDYTRDAPRWVTSDGVHLTRTGAFGMADLISRYLAALDERACPVPWELLTPRADPCPFPVDELARRDGVPGVEVLYGL